MFFSFSNFFVIRNKKVSLTEMKKILSNLSSKHQGHPEETKDVIVTFCILNSYQNLEIQYQHVDNYKASPDELNSNYCT